MPFFKDLGGSSDKILGGPGGHEAYVTDKSFTVKTAANNGTVRRRGKRGILRTAVFLVALFGVIHRLREALVLRGR
jgi:hypothetical protein